jgi:hypothetical protein
MKVAIKHRIKGFVQEELAPLLDLLDRIVKSINDNPYVEYEDVQIETKTIEFAVVCSKLNKTPTAYHIIKKDSAVDVYTSGPEKWKNNLLYLKATVDSAMITVRIT